MRNKVMMAFLIAVFFLNVLPAFADLGETVGLVGEGIVELPVSLVKIVGGTLKLAGEVLILPFKMFGA